MLYNVFDYVSISFEAKREEQLEKLLKHSEYRVQYSHLLFRNVYNIGKSCFSAGNQLYWSSNMDSSYQVSHCKKVLKS